MKTFVLIVILTAVAVAAGLSFVLQAGASPGKRAAVSLDVSCGPLMLESGVDTLVTCDIVARNGSPDAIEDAVFSFQPASGFQIPDAYYFVSSSVDGFDHTVSPYRLDYDLGYMPAGAERRAQVRVIVRSTHDYGAEIVLRDATTFEEFDRRRIESTVFASSGAQNIEVSFGTSTIETFDGSDPDALIVVVQVLNVGQTELRDLEVELSLGPEIAGEQLTGTEWDVSEDGGNAVTNVDSLGTGIGGGLALSVKPTVSDCVYFTPAAIVRYNGEVTAKFADEGFVTPQGCDQQPAFEGQSGGGTVVGLPQGGFGPAQPDRDVSIVLVLWAGAALVLAGAAVPRSRG